MGPCLSRNVQIVPIQNDISASLCSESVIYISDLTQIYTCPECKQKFIPSESDSIQEYQSSPRLLCGGWQCNNVLNKISELQGRGTK